MRPALQSLVVFSLLVLFGSCAPESAPPAAPVAPVAPVAPARAPAKPAAAKPATKKSEPAKSEVAPDHAVASVLGNPLAARESKPAPAAPASSAAPARRAPRALPSSTRASGPFETSELGSRGLLHWLPPDAVFVVRLPHVESLGEIPRRTSIGALLQNPGMMMALCGPDGPLGKLQEKMHAELPELEALMEKLPELKGDLVLGLAHAETPAAGAAQTPKVTFALAFDAGPAADELQRTLDPLLEHLQRECAEECARPENAWGLSGWHDDACFEIRRFGNVFTALCGNDPQFAGGIRPGGPKESFARAPLVTSAADLNGAQQGLFELYLNADPGWKMVRSEAPEEARRVIGKLGLYDVHGVALALGLGRKGLSEAHTWAAPAHADVVSRVLSGAPASRDLARWIPEDATTAGLGRFDLRELYDTIVALLSEKDQLDLRRGLEQCRTQTGIDVSADVVRNLGPSFAMVSRGDPLGFLSGPAGVCLMIQTQDDDRTAQLIDKLMPLLPPTLKRRTSEFAGRTLMTLDVSPIGMPIPALSICRVDGALLIATDQKLLERCLSAGKEPGVKQPALAAALAGEGVIGATLSAPVGDLPATLSVLRRTESGLVISSEEGAGSLGTACVTIVPVLAAVGIPRLISARLEANQHAAEATLRTIASAQAQFQYSGALDVDHDGAGEYGFLDELSGTVNLRGTNERLEPPMLTARGTGEDGIWTRNGYHYVVYLPTPQNGALSRSNAKDGRDISPDSAEIHWTAYAWPADSGKTGNQVYVLDQEGDLLCCANRDGHYGGLEQRPAFDACQPQRKAVDRSSGKPYLGRDGQTWQMVPDGPR